MALPRLNLTDLDEAGTAVTQQAITAARELPRLTLPDITGKQEKPEIPFEGGHELTFEKPFGLAPSTVKLSGPEARFFAGTGKRLTDIGRRVKQLTGDEKVQAEIDEAARLDRPLMETAGGQLGYMAPDVIFGMQPRNLANTARVAGAYGGASGALVPLTSEEQEGGAAYLNPAMNALGAMVGQKVLGGAANMVGKASNVAPAVVADLANRGLIAGGRGTRLPRPPIPYADPAIKAREALATSQGVRTSIGDLDPQSLWRNFENTMEGVLPGRRSFMRGQQEDLKTMLENTRQQINKPVIDPATGQPMPDTYAMAKGLKDQYEANRTVARKLFKDVEKLAADPKVQPIVPGTLYHEAQRLSAERPEFFKELQDNGLWKKVIGVERDAGPQQSIILQPSGQPFQKAQLLDFSEVKALRSRLGSEWRSARAQDPEKARMMATLLRALDDDIDVWGQNTGNKALDAAYGNARAFYRENVVPYTDPQANLSKSPLFSNVAVKDKVDVETIPKGVFKEGRQQLAQDFMDLSTPQGQQAAKNELINEVIDAGLNPDVETGLSTSIVRHGSKYKAPGAAVFTPGERQTLSNAIDTLKTTHRAASMPGTPPRTGMRVAPWEAGSALMGSGVPIYYGLNALYGEELTPTERVAMSFALLPLAASAAARGGLGLTQSQFGKTLRFASPEAQSQALGTLQMLMRQGGKGAGAGVAHGLQQEGLRYPRIMQGTLGEDEEY